MSVRPNRNAKTYAPKIAPSSLHAVLTAGQAQRQADNALPMRHQSSFEQTRPPALRPQWSYDQPNPYTNKDDRTWGEWAYEKYDSGKEAAKGAGRYAHGMYNNAASIYMAKNVRRDIKALEEKMYQTELDSPEYKQMAAELIVLQERLLVLEQGIATHVGLMPIDDEKVVE